MNTHLKKLILVVIFTDTRNVISKIEFGVVLAFPI